MTPFPNPIILNLLLRCLITLHRLFFRLLHRHLLFPTINLLFFAHLLLLIRILTTLNLLYLRRPKRIPLLLQLLRPLQLLLLKLLLQNLLLRSEIYYTIHILEHRHLCHLIQLILPLLRQQTPQIYRQTILPQLPRYPLQLILRCLIPSNP